MEEKTVSQTIADKIKKIDWDNPEPAPIRRDVTKDELAKNISANQRIKTSYSLTKEDQDNLEDVWHYLKKKGIKMTKSDVVSEAFRDIRKKYLDE